MALVRYFTGYGLYELTKTGKAWRYINRKFASLEEGEKWIAENPGKRKRIVKPMYLYDYQQ